MSQKENPKQRHGEAKVPLQLVPPASIVYEALAMEEGAEKYGPFNWREDPIEVMTYIGACLRHIYAYIDGEEYCPKSGKPHLGHAKACLGIVIDATEVETLIDNRPPIGSASDLLRDWEQAWPNNVLSIVGDDAEPG